MSRPAPGKSPLTILLIGGTSETAPLADGIAAAGCAVLVSTATDVPLAIGEHPGISRRTGRLDAEGLTLLVREKGIQAIVDAAHPYAAELHATVQKVSRGLSLPCLVYRRPEALGEKDAHPHHGPADAAARLAYVTNHTEAARRAFADGRPVLLTTGSRNLAPYAAQARRTGVPLAVRVLNTADSLAACRAAGIEETRIIAGRGPFSIEENLAAIHHFSIGVLVTKESGAAGGFPEKLTAAETAGCLLVVVGRPLASGRTFESPAALIEALLSMFP